MTRRDSKDHRVMDGSGHSFGVRHSKERKEKKSDVEGHWSLSSLKRPQSKLRS